MSRISALSLISLFAFACLSCSEVKAQDPLTPEIAQKMQVEALGNFKAICLDTKFDKEKILSAFKAISPDVYFEGAAAKFPIHGYGHSGTVYSLGTESRSNDHSINIHLEEEQTTIGECELYSHLHASLNTLLNDIESQFGVAQVEFKEAGMAMLQSDWLNLPDAKVQVSIELPDPVFSKVFPEKTKSDVLYYKLILLAQPLGSS